MRAVYTCLLGGYETPSELAVARDSELPFLCFTDDPDFRSETWTAVLIEPEFPLDLVRSQRGIKIRGHAALDDFDETLYIDNSVGLKADPALVLDRWLAGHDFAVPLHSYRASLLDEFEQVEAHALDDPIRVQEQLVHYAECYPEALAERPYWNGMLARRNTPEVRAAMAVWYDHVLRYSRRDQLSATIAFRLAGLEVNAVELDNRESDLHHWPLKANRRANMRRFTRENSGPLVAEVARLKVLVRELDERHARDTAELRSSTSWKLTAPLRWLGGRLARATGRSTRGGRD